MNNKLLYEHIINNVAKEVKRILNEERLKWYDMVDHSHNAPGYYLKLRINGHYVNFAKYSTLLSKSSRENTVVDIRINGNLSLKNYPENKFGITVIERSKKSLANFRVPIQRDGVNVFTDERVDYLAFPFLENPDETGLDYTVYVLRKDIVKDVYDNLLILGKKEKDEFGNTLKPLRGNDGICLTNNFIKSNAMDVFTLKNYLAQQDTLFFK